MNRIRVDDVKDVSIKGFDLYIKSATGEPRVVKNGVVELLKGSLVLEGADGQPHSRAAIIGQTNVKAETAMLVPEFLKSETETAEQQEEGDKKEKKELQQEEVDELKEKINELEELRKELEKQQEELQLKEQEIEEEQQNKDDENEEAVELIIQQLEQSIQAMAEAVSAAAASPPPAPSASDEGDGGKKSANATATSSGSSNAAPGEQIEEETIFVEASLTSRSDSGDKGDFITNENKPSFEIKTLAGATITLIINDVTYTAVADSNGNAIITVDELEDGEYVVNVSAKDPTGATSSTTIQIEIDTVPPEASLNLDTDFGTHDDDNITNTKTPIYSGTISGDPVEVILTVGSKSYVIPPKNGDFSYELPELEDGRYDVTLTVTDAAGNETVIKEELIIDTVNNFSASIDAGSNSGITDDWITNDTSPTFRFDHETGATIQVRYKGKLYDVVVADESPSFYTLPFELDEGLHHFEFISVDLAGNRLTLTETVDIDNTPPTFEFQGLTSETNTGNKDDLITQKTEVIFKGTAEPGAKIVLFINGKLYDSIKADENSLWQIPLDKLDDGNYDFTIYAEDAAGNKSEVSSDTLTIDSEGPILTGGFDSSEDTGKFNNDGITQSDDLAFKVKTDAGISVFITIPELGIFNTLMTPVEGEDGSYSFVFENVPDEGNYNYEITAIDLAGNESQNVLSGTVVVDRSIEFFTAFLDESSDSGFSQEDQHTQNRDLTFRGTGEEGSKISAQVRDDKGNVIIPEFAGATVKDEVWELTLPTSLNDGLYTITLTIEDIAGNTQQREITVLVDNTASLTADMQASSDSGSSQEDRITNEDQPNFEGTADPGSKITVVMQHSSGVAITLYALANEDGNWVANDWQGQSLPIEGQWNWSIGAEDPAGNIAPSVTGNFTFDKTPPETSIELNSNTGFAGETADNTLDFVITSEPGATITVAVYQLINGVPANQPIYVTLNPVLMESGEYLYSTSALPDGDYVYHVTAQDAAGNSITTENQNITINTTLPELGTVSLTDASNSGSTEDNITNNQDLIFQGVGSEVGTRIYIAILDKATNQYIILDPPYLDVTSPNWSFQLPATLPEGDYEISFTAQNGAGGVSESAVVDVTIDITPPELNSIALEISSDSGVEGDFVTQNRTPIFKGSSEKDATIMINIFRGDVKETSITEVVKNADGTWSFPVEMELADGTYRWEAYAIDIAGNITELKNADQVLIIDTKYEGASAALDADSNSGSTLDNITRVTDPSISGKGEPNSTVKINSLVGGPPPGISVNVEGVPSVTVDSHGNWTMQLPTLALGDGVYTFEILFTDAAGNTKTVTNTIVLDTQVNVEGKLISDTGTSDSDGITNDSTPTFAGTGEANSSLKLIITYNKNGVLYTIEEPGQVDADGNWSITAPELEDGDYSWKVQITDVAGNTNETQDQSIKIDRSPPGLSEITLVTQGSYSADPPEINDQRPVFSGITSEANGFVSVAIYEVFNGVVADNPTYISTAVTADGNQFMVSPDEPLPPGEYQWSIIAYDTAGNRVESPQSTIIIDTTPPVLGDVSFTEDTDMKEVGGQSFTGDDTPSFTGSSEAGTRIKVEIVTSATSDPPNYSVPMSPPYVVVDDNGNWTFTPNEALNEGTYHWTVIAYDAAGNESEISGSFTVDTTAPTLNFSGLSESTDSGDDKTDLLTNADKPIFTGHVSEAATITIVLYDAQTGQEYRIVQFVEKGNWSIEATEILLEGNYSLQYFATDHAGNTSDLTPVPPEPSIDLVIDRTVEGGDPSDLGLDEDYDSANAGDTEGQSDQITNIRDLVITGTVEPGSRVEVIGLSGPAGVGPISLAGLDLVDYANAENGEWSIDLPSLLGERFIDGVYTYTLLYTDLAGNTKEVEKSFTLDTTIETIGGFDSETGRDGEIIYTNNKDSVSFSGKGTIGDKVTLILEGPNGIKSYTATVEMVDGKAIWVIPEALLGTEDGSFNWTINAVDAAGNKIEELSGQFVRDTTPPAMPTLSIVRESLSDELALGDYTNDSTPTFKIQGEPGSKVVFSLWIGTSTDGTPLYSKQEMVIGSNGEFIYTYDGPPLSPDGNFVWQVELTDVAGNTVISEPSNVILDTTPPNLTSASLENTTLDKENAYLKEPVFIFNGEAENEARVYLKLMGPGGIEIDVEPAYVEVVNGNWTYVLSDEVANLLRDGNYNWSFYAVDAAGNISTDISGSFTLDTVAPEITFDGLGSVDNESTDTGSSSDDLITSHNAPVFTGTITEAATITITLTSTDGQGLTYTFKQEVSEGDWSITADKIIADGRYNVSIVATDPAGNVSSPATVSSNLVIDTEVKEGSDHGLSDSTDSAANPNDPNQTSDNITNNSRPELSGKVEAGTTVTVSALTGPPPAFIAIPLDSIPTAVAKADGSWSIQLPDLEGLGLNLPDGQYSYTLVYEDVAGNTKEVNGSFVLDRSIEVEGGFSSATGDEVNADGIPVTNKENTVLFQGTGDEGDMITLRVTDPNRGVINYEVTVDADGNWRIPDVLVPHDGIYTWQISAVDPAGNQLEPKLTGSFERDTEPPSLTKVEILDADDTGFSDQDNITNNTRPTFVISGEAGVKAVITLVGPDGTITTEAMLIPENGELHYQLPDELSHGSYTWTVTLTDAAGNSIDSLEQNLWIDTQAPSLGEQIDFVTNFDEETGVHYVNDPQLTFSGTGEPSSRIYVELTGPNGDVVLSPLYVEVDATGNWTYVLDKSVADALLADLSNQGVYAWSIYSKDAAGNDSPAQTGSFVLDTVAPTVHFGSITNDTGEANDLITSADRPIFTGTSNEPATITITLVSTDLDPPQTFTFTGKTQANGEWTISADRDLPEGSFEVTIVGTDLAGNPSNNVHPSSDLVIDRTVEGGEAGDIGLSDASDSGTKNDEITNQREISLSGTVEEGTSVKLAAISAVTEDGLPISLNIDLNAIAPDIAEDGTWEIALPDDLPEGVYSYTLLYEDVAGNQKTVEHSFTIDRSINVTAEFKSATSDPDEETLYTNESGTVSIGGTGKYEDSVTLVVTGSKGYNQTFVVKVDEDGNWVVDINNLTLDDEYSWTVNATDAAGNVNEEITGSFIRDTQAPEFGNVALDPESDLGFFDDDGITSDDRPSFSIEGEPGAKVEIRVWSGTSATGDPLYENLTLTIPESGTLVYAFEGVVFNEGEYLWQVTMTDAAGNSVQSDPIKLVIDKTSPTIDDIVLLTDSGVASSPETASDWLTNVTTPSFSGTSQAGSRIYITITDHSVEPPVTISNLDPAFVVVDENGDWRYDLKTVLPEGNYSVQFKAQDLAGNEAPGSAQNIIIDTTPPEVTEVKFAEESDIGTSSTDRLTNDTAPTITGASEKGATVVVTIYKNIDGTLVAWAVSEPTVVENADGTWSISFADNDIYENIPLTDGNYQWSVVATDPAGNSSEPVINDFVVDTKVEDTSAYLDPEDDLGWQSDDAITSNVSDLTIKGTAEKGSTVILSSVTMGDQSISIPPSVPVSVVYNAKTGDYEWELDLPSLNLGEGVYTYTVIITDPAGNEKEVSNTITIDLTEPVISASVKNAVEDDVGTQIVGDGKLSFTGTTDEAANVEIRIRNPLLPEGSQQVDYIKLTNVENDWEHQFASELEDGTYEWDVTVTDLAGNVSTTSGSIVIDTKPPVIDVFELDKDSITSASGAEQLASNKENLQFNGTISGENPNQKLDIRLVVTCGEPPQPIFSGEKLVYAGDSFSFDFPTLAEGIYSWKFEVTDLAGNKNEKTGELLVDKTEPTISELTLTKESDTGESATDFYSKDSTPTFTGKTEAFADVVITFTFGDETFSASGKADANGVFTITLPTLPHDGVYSWSIEATDAAGNVDDSNTGEYTLDTVDPVLSEIELVGDTGNDLDPDSYSDWITQTKKPSFTGFTDDDADVFISIWKDNKTIALSPAITPNPDGSFSYDFNMELDDGTYKVVIATTDQAGNQSSFEKEFTIDTNVRNDLTLNQEKGTEHLTGDEFLSFSGRTDPDAKVELMLYDETGKAIGGPYPVFVDANTGVWEYTFPVDLPEGHYSVKATATDAAGNVDTTDPPYQVEIERTPPLLDYIQIHEEDNTGDTNDWITENQSLRITGTMLNGTSLKAYITGFADPIPIAVNPVNGSWTLTLADLPYGTYDIDFVAVDAAGNETKVEKELIIKSSYRDFTAGMAEESDSGVQDDDVTSNRQPTLVGTITPGYSMSVTINGVPYEVIIDEFGDWKIEIDRELADGDYTVVFTVYDTSNPPKLVPTPNYNFTVDNVASLDVDIDSDSNSGLKNDFITNAHNLIVNVKVEAGSQIIVKKYPTMEDVQSTVSPTEDWSFTLRNLAEGDHQFYIETIDPAGNEASEIITITIDRTPPEVTRLLISGEEFTSSLLTKESNQIISGIVDKDDIYAISIRINGVDRTVEWDPESGIFNIPLTLKEGMNNISLTFTDSAGNKTVYSTTVNIKNEIKFTYNLDNDNGLITGDMILNDDKIELSGSGAEGENVTLTLFDADGNQVSTAHNFIIDDSQVWTHSFTGLKDGTYTLEYYVTDEAGNSLGPREVSITLDTKYEGFSAGLMGSSEEEAKEETVIADLSTQTEPKEQEQSNVDSQNEANDAENDENRINTTRPSFTGTGEPGSTVYMELNGAERVAVATVGNNGEWIFTMNQSLANATHTIVIYAVDAAGNQSESETIIVTVDTQIDPIVYGENYEITGITIGSDDNIYINQTDTVATFNGTATESGTVTIKINDREYPVRVTAGQPWTQTLHELPEGNHVYSIVFEDLAGNTTVDDGKITVDKTIIISYRFEESLDSGYPGSVSHDRVTNSDTLGFDFEGTDTDVIFDVTVAGPDGFSLVLEDQKVTSKLIFDFISQNGRYEFEFVFTDVAGNTKTLNTSVTVDKTIVDISPEHFFLGDQNFAGEEPIFTNDKHLSLTFSPPSSEYRLVNVVHNGQGYNASKNSDGTWSFPPIPMTNGENTLTITAWDLAGNFTSTEIEVNYRGDMGEIGLSIEGESVTDIDNIETDYLNLEEDTLSLSGTVSAGTEISFFVNGVKQSELEVDSTGSWSQDLILDEGTNRIVIQYVDIAGNEKTVNFTTVLDTRAPIISVGDILDANGELVPDDTVKDDQITITGVLDTGSSINSILLNGVEIDLSALTMDRGDFALLLSGLTEGRNTITINAEDLAGNTKTQNVVIYKDSMLTDFELEDYPTENESFGANNKPFFSGTVEEGATVKIIIVNQNDPQDVHEFFPAVDKYGDWNQNIDLPEGNYSWSIEATDEAGNLATAPQTGSFIVDTSLENFQAQFDGEEISANLPTFSGTVEEGSRVEILLTNANTGASYSFDAAVNGTNWSANAADIAGGLLDGEYSWQVIATDQAGNSAFINSSNNITLDQSVSNFDAEFDGDAVSSEMPTFSGTVEEGSDVQIVLIDVNTGIPYPFDAVVDGTNWSGNAEAIAGGLPEGEYSWQVIATDSLGNSAIINSQSNITLDKSVSNFDAQFDGDAVSAEMPEFSGTVEEGSKVQVILIDSENNQFPLNVTVNGANWTANANNFPSGLPDGNYSWQVIATDALGNTDTINSQTEITIDSSLGNQATPETENVAEASHFSSALLDAEENNLTSYPTFSGTVDEGSSVHLSVTNEQTGLQQEFDAIVDGDAWIASMPDLAEGSYSWQAIATDAEGNSSVLTSKADFIYEKAEVGGSVLLEDTDAVKTDKVGEVNLSSEILESKVFDGVSMPDTKVELNIANTLYETQSDADGDWLIKVEFDQANSYEYQINYVDKSGNTQTETGSVTVGKIEISTESEEQATNAEAEYKSEQSASPSTTVNAPENYDMPDNNDNHY